MREARYALAVVLAWTLVGAGAPTLAAKGKIEFGFHYGSWGLNLLKPVIENLASDFAKQMKDEQLDKIREEHPGFEEVSSSNVVEFDSGGHTFGFELRWYPGGEKGSFSLGISAEKLSMRISLPKVSTSLSLRDPLSRDLIGFQADGDAEVKSGPLAFLLSVRWDIMPSHRIHPYVTFGLGLAGLSAIDNTKLTYNFRGVLLRPGEDPEIIEESASKTVADLKEEDRRRKEEEGLGEKPFDIPIPFFPFVMLHIGLKGKITPNVHLLVDFGVLDGFALRGGIAVRI